MSKRKSKVQRWRISRIRGNRNEPIGVVLAPIGRPRSKPPSSRTRSTIRTSNGG